MSTVRFTGSFHRCITCLSSDRAHHGGFSVSQGKKEQKGFVSHHSWTDALPTHVCRHVYNPGTTQRGLRGAQGARLVPEPQRTSARWHSLSPGSLHRSTTSRHVVSGVTGTSVKCCSLSLRNTVRNICQERDSSCQRPFLSPEPPSKCVCAGSHLPPRPPRHTACRAPGVPGVRSKRLTQKAKPSLSVKLSVICLS